MKKFLIYTDCFIFGGCENVLINITNYSKLREEFNIIYSYAFNEDYQNGLNGRVPPNTITIPLKIIGTATQMYHLKKAKRMADKAVLLLYIIPKMILRKIGFLNVWNYFLLKRFFKKQSPDILYINNGGYPGALSCILAVFAAKQAGVKKIFFNVNNLAFPRKAFYEKFIDASINRKVDFFSTASMAAKLELHKERDIAFEKIINFPNTLVIRDELLRNSRNILREEFNVDPGVYVIGSIGLLTRRKGYDVFIRALNEIRDELSINNVRVFIFGEGEEREGLQSLISNFELDNIVFLPGFRNNILFYLKDFDLFVLPSVNNEDFPYVTIEAMALAKPVIGTNVAGIPEQIIDGKTGFIVRPGCVEELSKLILLSINDKNRLREMGNRGQKRFESEFSYNKVMSKYYKFVKGLMNEE